MFDVITPEQYAQERALVDAASAYAESVMREGGSKRARNYLTAEESAAPVYAAVNNDMRGRVEQFEILNNPPEVIFAYIGACNNNGIGIDRTRGASYPVTVWTGRAIGYATRGATWRTPRSYISSTQSQFYARIAGREYTGRGAGEGICIKLRETAASKRARRKDSA